jgi:hypothetical protein
MVKVTIPAFISHISKVSRPLILDASGPSGKTKHDRRGSNAVIGVVAAAASRLGGMQPSAAVSVVAVEAGATLR